MKAGLSRFDLELLAAALRVDSPALRAPSPALLEACMLRAHALTDREGTRRATHDHVRAVLAAYLAEYSADGYDAETFVDWVVSAVVKPGGTSALVEFYERRAAALAAKELAK